MEVVYYTHPAFFEPALCLVRALSARARVHLLFEISAGAWQSAMFDAAMRELPPGIVPADPILAPMFPAGVREYWQTAASVHLVVHPSRRSFALSSWRVNREVLRFVRERADVLHVDDVDVSPRLSLALPGVRTRLVISVHDPRPHTGEHNWRKTLARRVAFPSADAFVLFHAASREAFASGYGIDRARIHIARLGVYDVVREWAPPRAGRNTRTVLFFGRVSPYKGVDDFCDAVPLIAARVPDARFLVAGRPIAGFTPPPAPAPVEMIDRYLSSAEAATLLRDAAVVVCPYRDASQSGVVLSAYAFQVPVVATTVGGLPEYVIPEKTGLLVPPADPRALADAVSRLLLDDTLAARLREGIRATAASTLNWQRTAEVVMNAYTQS